MVASALPWVWRLPYAYTCCNLMSRNAAGTTDPTSDRCVANTLVGFGLTPPGHTCLFDLRTTYQYYQVTWFMILSSYIVGFCICCPAWLLLLNAIVKCMRLMKPQVEFNKSTQFIVSSV